MRETAEGGGEGPKGTDKESQEIRETTNSEEKSAKTGQGDEDMERKGQREEKRNSKQTN